MKYTSVVFSIVLFSLVSGCRPKPLEIEIPPIEAQTVVFSQVIPDNLMTIALTKTIDALKFNEEQGDEVSQGLIDQLLVSDAEVTIAYRDVIDTLWATTPGLYISIQTPQYVNEDYTLKVKTKEGQILTSTSKMLPKVDFTNVTPLIKRTEKDTIVSVKYTITDLPGKNWYMLNFYTPRLDNSSGTGLDLNSFFGDKENVLKKTELVSDEIFESNTFDGEVFLDNVFPSDSLVVTLSNINEAYYNFLEVRKSAGNFFTELTKEPINSPSNIDGGLGFFNTHFPDIQFFDLNDF